MQALFLKATFISFFLNHEPARKSRGTGFDNLEATPSSVEHERLQTTDCWEVRSADGERRAIVPINICGELDMRSSKMFLIGATLAMALFAASIAQAQVTVDKNRSYFSPDQQFGFGVDNAGGHIQYALGPAFHLGLNLHLDFRKRDTLSGTSYDFGPYAKF